MIDYKRLMDVLSKMKMNANQFLLLTLLTNREWDLIYRFHNPASPKGRWVKKEDMDDLLERGYVRWLNPSERNYMPTELEVTEKFTKDLYSKDPLLAGEDYWNTYPAMLTINGKKYPARNLGKTTNKSQFLEHYAKTYGYDLQTHEKIMVGLRYAKKQGEIRMNILSYLNSEQYLVDYERQNEETARFLENVADNKDFLL